MPRSVLCPLFLCKFLILCAVLAQPIEQSYIDKLLEETVNVSQTVSSEQVVKILTRIEKSLEFYKKNQWSIDLRGACQFFITNLNLRLALNNSKMSIYDQIEQSPINSVRLEKIRLGSKDLFSFIRNRILARVPRLNMTRQVSALVIFTEMPWYTFTPPFLTEEDRYNWTQYINRTVQRKLNQSALHPFPSAADYVKDLTMDSKDAQLAYNITIECMRGITMNPINDSAWENRTELNETIEMTKCRMPRELRAQCYGYVTHGKQFPNNPWGHANFYRIALLTAARLARNCFFISPRTDLKVLHYLCFLALVQIDKLQAISPAKYDDQFYREKDSLTKHDFANLCLLNGLPQFIRKDLLDCANEDLVWNSVGCYGPAGAGKAAVSTPLPWWIIVRPNIHENKVCNRRQTASCLGYQASVLRALVQLGEPHLPPTAPPLKPGQDPDADWLPD